MEINWIKIVLTIINFGILYLILKHFFFEKVDATIEKREIEVKSNIDKAETDKNMAAMILKENKENLKNSKNEGKLIVEDHKQKAEKVSDDIIKQANEEGKLLIERAQKEVERQRSKSESEMKTQIIELSLLMSQKAIGETIDEALHRRLINDFIAKVGI